MIDWKFYVARHRDGSLELFESCAPYKYEEGGVWCYPGRSAKRDINEEDLPEGVNPQWEDEKPTEVRIKLEKL